MPTLYDANPTLGREIFGQTPLGDQRRTERLVETFDQLCRHPGGTLPDKLASPADLKALYRLCNCDTLTHAVLIAALRTYTLLRIAQHAGDVLIVHDTTELDDTTLSSLTEHLGQIGKGTHRGYLCHNVLAIAADTGQVLGLLDQILHCRAETPEQETLAQLRDRPTRESLLWPKGTAELPSSAQLIDVADPGASTFEFLEHEVGSGRRFVIRNGRTRKVYAGHESVGAPQTLRAHALSLPELGRMRLAVSPQKGRAGRASAEFALRGGPILVLPPHAKHGHHGNAPLRLSVVHVIEVSPPPGSEQPLEWLLLTNEPVQVLADAERVLGWYERRWVIEEYHKCLQTGCEIEAWQFTAVSRLQPAIGLLSAVALTLLELRDASRRVDAATRRADTVVELEAVMVLSVWRCGESKPDWTVEEFFKSLARLGGHQNRKHDHPPGWLILWRGWMKLQCMQAGYAAAQLKRCGYT